MLEMTRVSIPVFYSLAGCERFLVTPPVDDCRSLLDFAIYQTDLYKARSFSCCGAARGS